MFAAGEFWNAKPPAEWSREERERLLSASPWAIKTRAHMLGSYTGPAPEIMNRQGLGNAPQSSASAGLPRPGSLAGGIPRIPRINTEAVEDTIPPDPDASRPRSNAPVAFYGQVTVAWESAAPIRLARREPLGPEFENHYAIRVTGLPVETFMNDTGRMPAIFRLLTGAVLEARTGKHELPDYVLRLPERKSVVFAFPASGFPLRRADRFVSFSLDLNEMTLKVRFDLRLMSYLNLSAL